MRKCVSGVAHGVGFDAESASSVAPGEVLRDVHNVMLSLIDQVYPDGSVGLIVESNYEPVPVSTFRFVDGKPIMSMTKADLESQERPLEFPTGRRLTPVALSLNA